MKHCFHCNQDFDTKNWECPQCGWQPGNILGFRTFAPEAAKMSAGFDVNIFGKLAHLEHDSFWFRSRNYLIVWMINRCFPKTKNFLEVGCGTGFVLSGISTARPDIRLTGSEVFLEGLHFASKRLPNVEFMQMDARNIPFKEEFDVVGTFDVLEHIVEDERVLQEMHRSLKPEGGLILTVPQHRFLWSAADESARHVRRYEAADLKAKLTRAGFHVLRLTSFVSFLLPLMMMSRMRKGKARKQKKRVFSNELLLPKTLDVWLENIMRLEFYFIKKGYNLPFGGSLLVLAKKATA